MSGRLGYDLRILTTPDGCKSITVHESKSQVFQDRISVE